MNSSTLVSLINLFIFIGLDVILMNIGVDGYSISCGLRQCKGNNIVCPAEEECNIDCRDWYACQDATITCPDGNYDCTLTCRNVGACWGATIHGSQDGSSTGKLLVTTAHLQGTSGANSAKKGLTVNCPENGDCIVD